MHAYRRFVEEQLAARRWRPADLERAGGPTKQTLSKILGDDRDHLVMVPDDATLERLACGFGVPLETVRKAVFRSIRGYTDAGAPLTVDVRGLSIDVLLHEIRRRVVEAGDGIKKVDDLGQTLTRGITEARRDEGLEENGKLL